MSRRPRASRPWSPTSNSSCPPAAGCSSSAPAAAVRVRCCGRSGPGTAAKARSSARRHRHPVPAPAALHADRQPAQPATLPTPKPRCGRRPPRRCTGRRATWRADRTLRRTRPGARLVAGALHRRAAAAGLCPAPPHQPRVAILDEATSALDSANEAVLYRRLRRPASPPSSASPTGNPCSPTTPMCSNSPAMAAGVADAGRIQAAERRRYPGAGGGGGLTRRGANEADPPGDPLMACPMCCIGRPFPFFWDSHTAVSAFSHSIRMGPTAGKRAPLK